MYVLSLDEWASADEADHRHFVLAGVCAIQRATHRIERKLNAVAGRFGIIEHRFRPQAWRDPRPSRLSSRRADRCIGSFF
jgi:hypothetical protein